MAVIIKPMLPPKKGYVEVDVDGVRKYRDIETDVIYAPDEIPVEEELTSEEILDALLGVTANE